MSESKRKRRRETRAGWLVVTVGIVAALLSGCSAWLKPTPAPIGTRWWREPGPARPKTLVVFLPGRGDAPEGFEREGMVAALREAGVRADAVAVNAHLGYYYRRTVIERLETDVLRPARNAGYRRIVLVGISLGGLGALLDERERPGSADALVLIAPYLGERPELFADIAAAGGPQRWATGRDPRAGGVEEQVWTFLGTRADRLPPTWLLFGQEDRFATGHRLLAPLLPAAHVRTIPGGHDWPTWRALWREACADRELFPAAR